MKSTVTGGRLAYVPTRTPIGDQTSPANDSPGGCLRTMQKLSGRIMMTRVGLLLGNGLMMKCSGVREDSICRELKILDD